MSKANRVYDGQQDSVCMADPSDRLTTTARELWGDRWRLETITWADETADHTVYHNRGVVESGGDTLLERDKLILTDENEILHIRERVRKEQRVDSEVIGENVDE